MRGRCGSGSSGGTGRGWPALATVPVGWGWVAAREAEIPELGITFALLPGDRYLWDFTTLPAWRGHDVYPALLQAILVAEEATRFWIGHDRDNAASARGMAKAGFREVGTAHRRAGRPAPVCSERVGRARRGRRGLPQPPHDRPLTRRPRGRASRPPRHGGAGNGRYRNQERRSTQSSRIAAVGMGSGGGWHDLCQVTRLEVLTLSQPSDRSSGEDE